MSEVINNGSLETANTETNKSDELERVEFIELEPVEQKNIFQRLLAVKKLVPYLKKRGKVSFANTTYETTTSEDVLTTINAFINANGLFLHIDMPKQEVTEYIETKITKDGKQEKTKFKVTQDIIYTWVNTDNPSETLVSRWAGFANGDDSKAMGAALTFAERYYLLKEFNVPTGKDDPDKYVGVQYFTEAQTLVNQAKSEEVLSEIYNEYKALVPDLNKFNSIVTAKKEALAKANKQVDKKPTLDNKTDKQDTTPKMTQAEYDKFTSDLAKKMKEAKTESDFNKIFNENKNKVKDVATFRETINKKKQALTVKK